MELGEATEKKSTKWQALKEQGQEFLRVFIIAVALILPIRLFLIQPFYVHGQSMEPSFYDSDYLIIDKITLRLRKIERGEVVVFQYRVSDTSKKSRYLIKRVIALPGERIRISDGAITIFTKEHTQGLVLREDVYHPRSMSGLYDDRELGEDEYYVLGDNRPVSEDSENFGPISKESIVGRVWVRGFPFQRFGVFDVPAYQ
ncbi:signal peptidase I [Candidatus Uhrbacteria bacterium]|nr:signal peptidase I [Candidatus Uhrbacteria bacterium]